MQGILEAQLFGRLDFLSILGYLTKLPSPVGSKCIIKFHKHNGSTTPHVTSFIEFISDISVVHENVMMKMFAHTFEDKVDAF